MTRYTKITAPHGKFAKPFIAKHVGGIHKMGCCDCGLIHNMKFSAWLKKYVRGALVGYERLSPRHVVVMIQAARNERATAAKRRAKQKFIKRRSK